MEAEQILNVESVLAALKPFQRRSADYIFDRFYGANPTFRFLLADEVGLGKTVVARGIIAKTIAHLWETVPQIDVIYICSNQDIARQNLKRLNPTSVEIRSPLERITLLPRLDADQKSEKRKLNLIAITPGTSLEHGLSGGQSRERVLLYHLLDREWHFEGSAPSNVLQLGCGAGNFRWWRDTFFGHYQIDGELETAFRSALGACPQIRERFFALCDSFPRSDSRIDEAVRVERLSLIGELRELLARTCIRFLQPDLIILDEFQRFKDLLDKDTDAGELAHGLFDYADSDGRNHARVLLLSATPYKMYTVSQEYAEDDHYADFIETLRFLLNDSRETEHIEGLIKEYRQGLYHIGEGDESKLEGVRRAIEEVLRRVICRTERLSVTEDRCGMLKEIIRPMDFLAEDVRSYLRTQQIGRSVGHPENMEFWKSAPYLLNFMDDYQLKRAFEESAGDQQVLEAMTAAINAPQGILLQWAELEKYQAVPMFNSRLRQIAKDTLDAGTWRCLWIPPSLPYYRGEGPFAELSTGFTKRLVFSAWQVVPRAVASLLSYEAERRMMMLFDTNALNTQAARERRRPLLTFARSSDRLTGLTGMPVLAMLYPSMFLAETGDPLRACGGASIVTAIPPLGEVISAVEQRISEALCGILPAAGEGGAEDENWYWAAPLLLDLVHDQEAAQSWWKDESLALKWSGEEESEAEERSAWEDHVERARTVAAEQELPTGRPPADLARVLALLAVGGPAVSALRALSRVAGGDAALRRPEWRHLAGQIGWAFRTLFNFPEVNALVRGLNQNEPYWRRVIEYCVNGNIQSVLDEYTHMLSESVASIDGDQQKVAEDVAKALCDAVSLRVAQPLVDRIYLAEGGQAIRIEKERLRARFAMRFGDERSDDGSIAFRADRVRCAFNSPFWPFVLITTSVGQEGLDFHPYCHAVVHWNLPSNPVDLEQREGRVHRYKGHAVRRNVAKRHGASPRPASEPDPWRSLFKTAATAADDPHGLKPYWVYPVEQGEVIERHVPALPLSREAERLPALRRSLAVYRMVFGQPRQDDLLAYLLGRFPREELQQKLDRFRINLTPDADQPQ